MTKAITSWSLECKELRHLELRARLGRCTRRALVKLSVTGAASATPVLVLAPAAASKTIQAALGSRIAVTSTDQIERARALAATGGFVAVLAVEPLASSLRDSLVIDAGKDAASIAGTVTQALALGVRRQPSDDSMALLPYEEYIELARYGVTRRYLIALLQRHGGSVTDAARGADMKRESLHRLMRRHHLNADEFRIAKP